MKSLLITLLVVFGLNFSFTLSHLLDRKYPRPQRPTTFAQDGASLCVLWILIVWIIFTLKALP